MIRNKERISEKKVQDGLYAVMAELFKILASRDRLRILAYLNPEPHTFSEIMFAIGKNPSIVSRHLEKLQKYNLVEKGVDRTYKATEIGILALNATTKDIVGIVEQALQIAKTQEIAKE